MRMPCDQQQVGRIEAQRKAAREGSPCARMNSDAGRGQRETDRLERVGATPAPRASMATIDDRNGGIERSEASRRRADEPDVDEARLRRETDTARSARSRGNRVRSARGHRRARSRHANGSEAERARPSSAGTRERRPAASRRADRARRQRCSPHKSVVRTRAAYATPRGEGRSWRNGRYAYQVQAPIPSNTIIVALVDTLRVSEGQWSSAHLRHFVRRRRDAELRRAPPRLRDLATAAVASDPGGSSWNSARALFARRTRGVRLHRRRPRRCCPRARRLLREADALVDGARHLAEAAIGSIADRLHQHGVVQRAAARHCPRFHRRRPGIRLRCSEATSDTQQGALVARQRARRRPAWCRRSFDAGRALRAADAREPLVAALPARRRWPRRAVARLARGGAVHPVPAPGRGRGSTISSSASAATRDSPPRIEQEAIQMPTIVSLVAAGMGVALVPASLRHMRRTGVVYRALAEASPLMEVGLAWRDGEEDPAGRAFIDHARSAVQIFRSRSCEICPHRCSSIRNSTRSRSASARSIGGMELGPFAIRWYGLDVPAGRSSSLIVLGRKRARQNHADRAGIRATSTTCCSTACSA